MADEPPPPVPPIVPPVVVPREALRYLRAKGYAIGFSWQDVWQDEHARAFTVAKAMSRDLLETIREAVDRALADGETLATFTKELRPILEAKGWWGRKRMFDPLTGQSVVAQLGSPRRLKTIFQVNMRTAYQAGRWERIQRSKKMFPFLRYVSVMDGRERPEHHAWHNTVLPVDHPWWDTHYPPCGWNCRCTAIPMNARMMARKGLVETEQPKMFPTRPWTNKRTGEVHDIEQGIDPGWSYNAGKAALDGLAPPPLGQAGEEDAISAAQEGVYAPLNTFFAVFGLADRAEIRRGTVWSDADGWPLAISLGLFRDPGGALAIPQGRKLRLVERAAATIADPDEIRLRWISGKDGKAMLMRRYVTLGANGGAVDIGRVGWRWHAGDPEPLRRGIVIWSRDEAARTPG